MLEQGAPLRPAGMFVYTAVTSADWQCSMRSRLLLLLVSGITTAVLMSDGSSALAADVSAISAGSGHTCAITGDAQLKCWGGNWSGQIGSGTAGDAERTPVDVIEIPGGVETITAGSSHTCAVTISGGLKCWGDNQRGQLGDGTGGDKDAFSPTPIDVADLGSAVVTVAAGSSHTCALTVPGGVKCWGRNDYGQLGAQSSEECFLIGPLTIASGDGRPEGAEFVPCSTRPLDVAGLDDDIEAIALGSSHSCALTTGGQVKCWGLNHRGQLGVATEEECVQIGSLRCSRTPVEVTELPDGVIGITAGADHTCALLETGGVLCWGDNFRGQLGTEMAVTCEPSLLPCSTTPIAPDGLEDGIVAIDAGSAHTCALTEEGQVMCWGQNGAGQLGDGTGGTRSFDYGSVPVDVCVGGRPNPCRTTLLGAVAIAAGGEHSCALMTTGGIWCWGGNGSGQLGDGTRCCQPYATRTTPMPVVGLGDKSPLWGDANCTDTTDSIDASHILRVVAGLLESVRCPQRADVNQDDRVDSLDTLVILQYVAGLLERLPTR